MTEAFKSSFKSSVVPILVRGSSGMDPEWSDIDFSPPGYAGKTGTISSTLGEEVKTLINKRLKPGMHTLEWDGTDNFGNIVSSGVYLYSFDVGNIRLINKLLLLK